MLPLNEVHKNMRHKLKTLGTRLKRGKKKLERVENVVNKKRVENAVNKKTFIINSL